MHYREFYGLNMDPFNNVPDLRFYYPGNLYSRIYTRLMRVAQEGRGLAILTGKVGTGKTTMARQLLYLLRGNRTLQTGLLVLMHSEFEPGWLVKRIAGLIGINEIPNEKTDALAVVTKKLLKYDQENKHTVILIDEANKMINPDQLEEVRGFLNLEKGDRRLVTFILFGTSELLDNVKSNQSLSQRVIMRLTLKLMDFESTIKYIRHRLSVAGARRDVFAKDSYNLIYRYTKGNPRVTNALCDNVLFEGALANYQVITPSLVEEVAMMLGFEKEV